MPISTSRNALNPSSAGVPFAVQAGDFNGDGRVDLAAISADGSTIVVLPGRGDGTFGPSITTPGVPGPITASGDFNHDGTLDLIAGETVLAGNGDGTFRPPIFLGIVTQSPCGSESWSCAYANMATAIADFNRDGLPDVVFAYVI
jgi:hypothetical protein